MTPTAAPIQQKEPLAAETGRSVSTSKRAKDPFSQIFDQKMAKVAAPGSEDSASTDDKTVLREKRRRDEPAVADDPSGENMILPQLVATCTVPLPDITSIKTDGDFSGSCGSSDFADGKNEGLNQATGAVAGKASEVAQPALPEKTGVAVEKAVVELEKSSVENLLEPIPFETKKELPPLQKSKEELAIQEPAANSEVGEGSKPEWMIETNHKGGGDGAGREGAFHRPGSDGMEAAKLTGDMRFWSDKGLENTIEPAFPAGHGHSAPEQIQRAQLESVALRVGSVDPSNIVSTGTVQGVGGGEGHVDSSAAATLPRELQPILEEMWETVTNFQVRNASRLVVQIRPDDATRLKLVVQQNKGRVEIQAEVQRGDSQTLSDGWSQLQSSLAEKGVVLRSLEVSQIFQPTTNELANQMADQSGRQGSWARESEPEHLDWEDRIPSRPVTIPVGRFQPAPSLAGAWERWA